jgi:hypothetical protein
MLWAIHASVPEDCCPFPPCQPLCFPCLCSELFLASLTTPAPSAAPSPLAGIVTIRLHMCLTSVAARAGLKSSRERGVRHHAWTGRWAPTVPPPKRCKLQPTRQPADRSLLTSSSRSGREASVCLSPAGVRASHFLSFFTRSTPTVIAYSTTLKRRQGGVLLLQLAPGSAVFRGASCLDLTTPPIRSEGAARRLPHLVPPGCSATLFVHYHHPTPALFLLPLRQ